MKRILLLTSLLFLILTIKAQTNYYPGTKTFNENGYTYQCDVKQSGMVYLYNKNYSTKHSAQRFKATGEQFFLLQYENEEMLYDEDATEKAGKNRVKAILAPYKSKLKDNELMMSFIINSDTGKIDEVYFNFTVLSPYVYIPLSVYREIELSLIGTQFKLTEFGKRLNYLYLWWAIAP